MSYAESKGFEPLVPGGTLVFETSPFDHSGNSPYMVESTRLQYFCQPETKTKESNKGQFQNRQKRYRSGIPPELATLPNGIAVQFQHRHQQLFYFQYLVQVSYNPMIPPYCSGATRRKIRQTMPYLYLINNYNHHGKIKRRPQRKKETKKGQERS